MDVIRPYLDTAWLLFLLWLAVSIFFGGFGFMRGGPKGFRKVFDALFLGPLKALLYMLKAKAVATVAWFAKKSWKVLKRFAKWFGRKVWHG